MVVDDASHDPRVAGHPLVSGAAHVSFIAAAPLRHDGHSVGALCVFDNRQRSLDASPGVGLGLAVTQRILRAQCADLRFANSAGGGFTVQIAFG